MSHINEKMGLGPAGKRDMMKLPKDRALAVKVTAATCPRCERTGAKVSRTQPGSLYCTWCNFIFPIPEDPNNG